MMRYFANAGNLDEYFFKFFWSGEWWVRQQQVGRQQRAQAELSQGIWLREYIEM